MTYYYPYNEKTGKRLVFQTNENDQTLTHTIGPNP